MTIDYISMSGEAAEENAPQEQGPTAPKREPESIGLFFKSALSNLVNVDAIVQSVTQDLRDVATYVSEQSQSQVKQMGESMTRLKSQLASDIKETGNFTHTELDAFESSAAQDNSASKFQETRSELDEALERKLRSMFTSAEQVAGSILGNVSAVLSNVKDAAHHNLNSALTNAKAQKDDAVVDATLDPAVYSVSDEDFENSLPEWSKLSQDISETNFTRFKANFSLDSCVEQINELLKSNSQVHDVYSETVPEVLEAKAFWLRYFWKKLEYAHSVELKAKALSAMTAPDEFNLTWDEEEAECAPSRSDSSVQVLEEPSLESTKDSSADSAAAETFEIVEKGTEEGDTTDGQQGWDDWE